MSAQQPTSYEQSLTGSVMGQYGSVTEIPTKPLDKNVENKNA